MAQSIGETPETMLDLFPSQAVYIFEAEFLNVNVLKFVDEISHYSMKSFFTQRNPVKGIEPAGTYCLKSARM